jgi:3-methylfumaryl-CoA hydratase
MEPLSNWEGRTEQARDDLTAALVAGLLATLDRAGPDPARGEPAPPGAHWMLGQPRVPVSQVGPDGHPARGGFLPPVSLPRRMWAGSRLDFVHPLCVGDHVTRTSTVASVREKTGSSGDLVFVEVDHVWSVGRPAVRERQTIVYRGDGARRSVPAVPPGPWPLHRTVATDPVLLFRYSALTFNGHRIHYDAPYARDVEGYPGLVVHAPLMATLLLDLCSASIGGHRIATFSFRGESPAIVGERLTLLGRPGDDTVTLAVLGEDGRLVQSAEATLAG